MNVVSVSDLAVSYGRTLALDGITFTMPPGELLVVLGMNGSGKTTLMKAVAGLLPLARGSVQLFQGVPLRQAHARIGAVFDEPVHWDVLTGWENAVFFARSCGLSEGETEDRLRELFNWAGLWGKRGDPASSYSYGMRRKLTLIESLVHRPELLFLDEPSMGLDHVSRLALYRALKKLVEEGRSVMVTTNDLHEASALADRICVLNKGRLAAIAIPGDLMSMIDQAAQVRVAFALPVDLAKLEGVRGVGRVDTTDPAGGRSVTFLVSSARDGMDNVLARIVERSAAVGAGIVEVKVERPDLGQVLLKLSEGAGDGPH
jgi:ABC-type multidrug transport system ATPase subunit